MINGITVEVKRLEKTRMHRAGMVNAKNKEIALAECQNVKRDSIGVFDPMGFLL
ncbi:MAG: hypothetical protein IJJ25_12025 [Lachnospiraceae bacterium]|nr:hypothetical protein [Lachnospiraceae bacterium]